MNPWVWLGALGAAALVLRPSKVLARGPTAGLVARGSVTSPYAMRQLPGEPAPRQHQGIDVSAPVGTEVRSPRAGTVVDVSPDGVRTGYGNTVIVEHPGGVLTLHAHLKGFGPGIRVGTVVERGDVLGYVGATHLPNTNPMAPHLHFEVLLKKVLYRDKIVVNPQTPGRTNPEVWLKQSGVRLAA